MQTYCRECHIRTDTNCGMVGCPIPVPIPVTDDMLKRFVTLLDEVAPHSTKTFRDYGKVLGWVMNGGERNG